MAEKVLMKGNEALAESALRAGCRFFFGYPITPQTELAAYMSKRMPKIGGTYLQAESEIAAINMVYGAASAGARAMTSSSVPEFRLKARASRTWPARICRASSSTCSEVARPRRHPAFPVRLLAGDARTGHGDFFMPVLAPSTVQEMADCVYRAFDLADEYCTPVMVLADGMLGQMMEPVVLPEVSGEPPEKPWATTGHKGKRSHNIVNSLYLTADALEKLNIERFKRYEVIREGAALGSFHARRCGNRRRRIRRFEPCGEKCGCRCARGGHQSRSASPDYTVAVPNERDRRRALACEGVPVG